MFKREMFEDNPISANNRITRVPSQHEHIFTTGEKVNHNTIVNLFFLYLGML